MGGPSSVAEVGADPTVEASFPAGTYDALSMTLTTRVSFRFSIVARASSLVLIPSRSQARRGNGSRGLIDWIWGKGIFQEQYS